MSLWIHVSSPAVGAMGAVAHAVDPFPVGLKSKRRTVPTVCGKQRAKYLGVTAVNEAGQVQGAMTAVWPPYVAEMADMGLTRCPDCMALRPGKPHKLIPDDSRYLGPAAVPA